MPTWSLLVWLAVGVIVGLVARRWIGGMPPFGKIGDLVLGAAGGVVGGFLLALSGIGATIAGLIGTMVAAAVGAGAMIALSNKIKTKG